MNRMRLGQLVNLGNRFPWRGHKRQVFNEARKEVNAPCQKRRALVQMSVGMLIGGFALSGTNRAYGNVLSSRSATRVLPANSRANLDGKGMQLIITGSGSALPDPYRGGASCAIIIDGRILQFDFGRGVMENLMLVGVNPMLIDEIFFTHLHFDHINDYDYYATTTWIAGRQDEVLVFGPKGTKDMSDSAIKLMHRSMYNHISKMHERPAESMEIRPLQNPPFVVKDIVPGIVVESDAYKVTAIKVPHMSGDEVSLGYRIDSEYGSVAISGDTGPSAAMVELAKDADILVHECTVPDQGTTEDGSFSKPAFFKRKNHGHTTPSELGRLANEANVKLLVPYHLPPYGSVAASIEMSSLYYGVKTDARIWADFIASIKENFHGPVVLAEDRMIFTLS